VTRFNGVVSFLPGLGLTPEILGEPVWLHVTDERTGTTWKKQYDLIRDVQDEHPVLKDARFVRRMFD
jgi:hypothetical protein